MNLLLSIIIPTFNSEKYIPNVINSLSNQRFKNFEVVIVDNLSTDSTTELVKHHSEKINIQIISEKDKGIYDAMNKGIQYAKGEWIYFMGADDNFVNEKVLENITPYLKEDHDIVYGDSIWIPENSIEGGEWSYSVFINRNINHQRIFYRKKLFQQNGSFNLKYTIASDHEMNIRFFCNTAIHKKYVPITVATFNSTGFSANKIDLKFWEDWEDIFLKNFKPYLSKKVIYGSLSIYYRSQIDQKNYGRAIKLLYKHFRNNLSIGFIYLSLQYTIKKVFKR